MKIEIEIEATPAEVREFLGLPDLQPLHAIWLERMKAFAGEGPSAEDWQKLMAVWANGAPQMAANVAPNLAPNLADGMAAWQKMMAAGFTPPKKD